MLKKTELYAPALIFLFSHFMQDGYPAMLYKKEAYIYISDIIHRDSPKNPPEGDVVPLLLALMSKHKLKDLFLGGGGGRGYCLTWASRYHLLSLSSFLMGAPVR